MTKWFQSRQVRAGGYSGAYILVFVAILGAANYLANRYNKTYDATADRLYSLSDQTLKVVGDLKQDVTIYYFDQKSRFGAARSSLTRYENASPKVSVKYADPDSDPAMAQAMNVRTYGSTLVEIGPRRQEARTSGEEDVTNAIIQLLKGESKRACIVSGHGESDPADSQREGFSSAQTEIRGVNYETETISLATGEVPADCTVVIVAGPTTDFFEPEVEALRRYAAGGGRVLLMLDAHTEGDKTPLLSQLAAEWGVEARADVVIDLSPVGQLFGGGPLTPMITDFDALHPITKPMGNTTALFPMSRTVVSSDSAGDWRTTELLKTTAQSFATTTFEIRDSELVRNAAAETQGPLNVAVAATFDVPGDAPADAGPDAEKPEEKEGRVVVSGSSRFARNNFLNRGANSDLFLNMLNWLTSDEDLISIRPKDPANTPMEISASQMRTLFFGLVLGLPLLIVVAGVRTWWVRR